MEPFWLHLKIKCAKFPSDKHKKKLLRLFKLCEGFG